MKQKFLRTWNRSKQPRKQRKYLANAPLHIKRKFLSSHLKKDLREKYKKRSFPVVTGDKVKIMRGQFRGREAKVERVNHKKERVYLTGVERTKKEGGKSIYPFRASNLLIIELNLKDTKRKEALERNINQATQEKTVQKK